jgi:phosphoribosyl-AMP cyclohydrolase
MPRIARDLLEQANYDSRGLIPAIAQDAETGEVLMLAWMDAAALARTLDTAEATYFSRSRQRQWIKGETSGHTQRVIGVRLDCDGDTVLLEVEQIGPACHTGNRTCFSGADAVVPKGAAR